MIKQFLPLLLVVWCNLATAQQDIRFLHLDHRINNHEYQTVSMVQDTMGYLWLSNIDGINKYNGYDFTFTSFKTIFGIERNGDQIEQIVKDTSGALWVISTQGLISRANHLGKFESLSSEGAQFENYPISYFLPFKDKIWVATKSGEILTYDPENDTIKKIIDLPIASFNSLGNSTLVLHTAKELYIYTDKGHLYLYDIGKGKLNHIFLGKGSQISYNTAMVKDDSARLWLCTSSPSLGILVYDIKSKKFIEHSLFSKEELNKTKTLFATLVCDSKGIIWAGTDGNGLFRINADDGRIDVYTYDAFDMTSLSSNSVIDIYEDELKNLWVANNYGNISVLRDQDESDIKHHSGTKLNIPAKVMATIIDEDGTFWFGTDGQGLTKVSADHTDETQFLANENLSDGMYIYRIVEGSENEIWMASVIDGIWIFDKEKESASKFEITDRKGHSVYQGYLVYKDSRNRIWVSSELGIFIYDLDHNLLAVFEKELQQEGNPSTVANIVEDKKGKIWLGTMEGLMEFVESESDLADSTFKRHPFFDEEKEKKSNRRIRDVAIDDKGIIWVISLLGNLFSFNCNNGEYQSFMHDAKYAEVDFKAIEVQDTGNIWLSSNKGLWHINTTDSSSRTYFKSDGLLDDSFLRSSYKDHEGNLYFASLSGMNYFDPEKLFKKETNADLYIEQIEIGNKNANVVLPDQINTIPNHIKNLKLNYDQSSFSINFAAVDNVVNPRFYYGYRLKGFDDSWVISNDRLKASYTNIPSGNYEFQVRAGTREGIWDIGEKTVQIQISPPFYRQTWAYAIYFLIFLCLAYAFYRWILLKNKLVAEKLAREKDNALYEMKMDFFSKISHEIQTPLTLILIPINSMLERAKTEGNKLLEHRLKMISHNTKRLSRIVLDLTTVRNKELGKLRLRVSQNNLVEDLRKVKESFDEAARHKKIIFTQKYEVEEIEVWYDREKVEHVFYNLLSNAFKFAPHEGCVEIEVDQNPTDKTVRIVVYNSGPAIKKEDLNSIFDLFYQGKSDQMHVGMGIGLALSKEIVDLHCGTINVRSDDTTGTFFTVEISTQDDCFTTEQKVDILPTESYISTGTPTVDLSSVSVKSNFSKTILIIDDSFELVEYLEDLFKDYYNVLVAYDGAEGLELTKKHIPQLVISDIKMPKLNGIAMSELIQSNKATAHIPIILLTAENTSSNKMSALRAGVIEYFPKPFDVNELLLKSNNIITRSDRLKQKILMDLMGDPTKPDVKSKDELFFESLVDVIEKNLSDPQFKLEVLSENLNMSYSTLYRKFQSLTGKTIVDFLRSMRLKQAAMYLVESNYSVADAAYAVGFNDAKYFSKCFKKEFGTTPSEYKNQS